MQQVKTLLSGVYYLENEESSSGAQMMFRRSKGRVIATEWNSELQTLAQVKKVMCLNSLSPSRVYPHG